MKPSQAWEGKLASVEGFTQRVPHNGQPSTQHTVTYLGYDQKNLYAIFVCFDTEPDLVRARLSRREDIFDDDYVEIMLDTFHDHRHAYAFVTNPLGIQADAIWTEGQDFDFSFDTVWDSHGQVTSQGYVVMMAIPFRSLRFSSEDVQSWGIMLNRGIIRTNEDTFWPPYSTSIAGRLNQEGDATGLSEISPGRNLQLIPYGIFQSYKEPDLRDPLNPTFSQRDAFGQVGLDAKAVVHDEFVFDVTVNPDFSQIESDQPQVTVNQRFEVFFPEKRPFFLENANYFNTPIDLVFTRRIEDPDWGARLTGKQGPWGVGMLVANDAGPGNNVPLSDPLAGKKAYFAIGRLTRDVGKQSFLGLLYTDREMDGYFNRVGGIDGRAAIGTHWTTSFQGVVSSTYNVPDDTFQTTGGYQAGPAAEVKVQRQGTKFNYFADYSDRANDFRTLTGFDPQPDIRNFYQNYQYTFHPEGRKLLSWSPGFENYYTFDHQGNYLNSGYLPQLHLELPGLTNFGVLYAKEMELLRPRDFDSLTENTKYVRHTTELFLDSLYFPKVSLHFNYRFGTRINYDPPSGEIPFLAGRTSVEATVTLRPTRSLRIDNTYILFRLHSRTQPTGALNNDIIRSKWNYQFTPRASFRFIGEYNAVLANPNFTSLQTTKLFNADFLFTYLVHPSTAIYVGYNTNYENVYLPLTAIDSNGDLLRQDNMVNNGRNFFIKASYMFRF